MHPLINKSLVTIEENHTAHEAAQLMKQSEAGSLIVVDVAGKLVGILTGRDLVLNVMAPGKAASAVAVKEVMTRAPTTARVEDMDLKELARILARSRVRRLPIVDHENRPIGMIALEDFLVYAADIVHSLSTAVAPYLTVARLKSAHMGVKE